MHSFIAYGFQTLHALFVPPNPPSNTEEARGATSCWKEAGDGDPPQGVMEQRWEQESGQWPEEGEYVKASGTSLLEVAGVLPHRASS